MSLSSLKTKYTVVVVFTRRPRLVRRPTTVPDGAWEERVNQTKFLGVIIIDDLKWQGTPTVCGGGASSCLYLLSGAKQNKNPSKQEENL